MQKRSIIVIFVGSLVLSGTIAGWLVSSRNAQREWPHTQLQNAVTLGAALGEHRAQHGLFPHRLEDLVSDGTMGEEEFAKLQFRSGPNAEPEPWLYRTPEQLSEIAIVAPAEIYSWTGHSGCTATARADGGGELVLGAKRFRVPAWALK